MRELACTHVCTHPKAHMHVSQTHAQFLLPRLAPGAAGTSSSSRGRFILALAWSWERGPAVLFGKRSWQTHRAASFLRRGPHRSGWEAWTQAWVGEGYGAR